MVKTNIEGGRLMINGKVWKINAGEKLVVE